MITGNKRIILNQAVLNGLSHSTRYGVSMDSADGCIHAIMRVLIIISV